MTETPRHSPSLSFERESRRQLTPAPYAGPARNEPTAGHRANTVAKPYVPAPFRGKPVLSDESGGSDALPSIASGNKELPWIDAFLEDAPGEGDASGRIESGTAASMAESPDTEWPLDETGATLREIGDGFPTPAEATEPADLHTRSKDMPRWSSGEWMDIMPVAHESEAQPRDVEVNDASERAARIMEDVAGQLRTGELQVSGDVRAMNDAAVVAAVLTALLGRAR